MVHFTLSVVAIQQATLLL